MAYLVVKVISLPKNIDSFKIVYLRSLNFLLYMFFMLQVDLFPEHYANTLTMVNFVTSDIFFGIV